MKEGHQFTNGAGNAISGIENMTREWIWFFELFPEYKSTFDKLETCENDIIMYRYII
jgi:hypothetical protein